MFGSSQPHDLPKLHSAAGPDGTTPRVQRGNGGSTPSAALSFLTLPLSDPPKLRIDVRPMDRREANALVAAHHYSHSFVRSSSLHLGVFAPGLLGVLQFGPAMNPASQASVVAGTERDEYLELNRMWLDDVLPRNSESRAVGYAMRYIRRERPKVAWIQSFADERCGRLGVVYQACNFVYCGEHTSTFWELDGAVYHNVAMTRKTKRSPRDVHLQENRGRAKALHLRQFRYLYFLRPGFRERLRHPEKPYPKPAAV